MKLELHQQIIEKSSNFIKMRQVRGELFRADGRTDMTKLIVASRNSANVPIGIYELLQQEPNERSWLVCSALT
jgi:hypothetical protein